MMNFVHFYENDTFLEPKFYAVHSVNRYICIHKKD